MTKAHTITLAKNVLGALAKKLLKTVIDQISLFSYCKTFCIAKSIHIIQNSVIENMCF